MRVLPYMMSAVVGGGGGVPKKQTKGPNQLICDSDKGGGVKKIRTFCGHHIWKHPKVDFCELPI